MGNICFKTIPISIKRDEYGYLYAKIGAAFLFKFVYCKETKSWLFWVSGALRKEIAGRAFPWIYFFDLCRAVNFVKFDEPIYKSDCYKVVSGKSYIR